MGDARSPPAKRSRVGDRTTLACIRCKQKKLKCDGASPRCQNCAKSGQQDCLIEDPATGLQRPRDYMQALESRVAYLEGLLQETRPEIAADHMGATSQQALAGGIPSPREGDITGMLASPPIQADFLAQSQLPGPRDSHVDQHRPGDTARSDPVSSDVALLCVNASGREPQYLGHSSALSFAHVATQAMGLEDTSTSQNLWSGSQPGDNSSRSATALELKHPSPNVAEALSRAYFENIHLQYPFLHQPTFKCWQQKCWQANVNGTLSEAGHVPLFFVTMVYAIGSIVLSHGLSDDAKDLYTMAMQFFPPILNTDTLESVQSLIACAVFSIRSPVGASLWMISGMAVRKSIGLGYHRSLTALRRAPGSLSTEMAKRCFWVAYDIDRVASFVLGRPTAISDQAIDAELPLDINDDDLADGQEPQNFRSNSTEPPTTMTGAIHVINLRRLWSKVHGFLYGDSAACPRGFNVTDSTIYDLRQELEDWRTSTPPQIQVQPSGAKPLSVYTSREWFTLAYNHSILLLYRPLINDTADQAMQAQSQPGLVDMAFEECYMNAQQMCMTYRSLYQQPTIQFTWGSLHILFLGGMTYLYCLWRSAKIRQTARLKDVMGTCMACSMVLVIIAERWRMATAYRDMFEKLAERTINMLELDASRRQQASSNAEAPASGFDGFPDDALPFDQWILDLDNVGVPPESDWLVQELLEGVRNFEPNGFGGL